MWLKSSFCEKNLDFDLSPVFWRMWNIRPCVICWSLISFNSDVGVREPEQVDCSHSCRKDTWRSMSMSPGLKLYLLQLEKPLIGAKTHTRTRAQADSTSLWQLCWQKANSKPSALNRVLTSHRRVLQSDLSLSQTHAYTHAHACKHTRPPTDWPL